MLAIDTPVFLENASISRNPDIYMKEIWKKYFQDIPRANQVKISYCYPWKYRLGLIRLSVDCNTSFIGLNSLLQLEQVPEYILITTIAHELVHYAHGFGSPLVRQYKHPHANNVVPYELERRGLGEKMHLCNAWIDKHWFPFYDRERETGWAGLPVPYRSTRGRRKSQQ